MRTNPWSVFVGLGQLSDRPDTQASARLLCNLGNSGIRFREMHSYEELQAPQPDKRQCSGRAVRKEGNDGLRRFSVVALDRYQILDHFPHIRSELPQV